MPEYRLRRWLRRSASRRGPRRPPNAWGFIQRADKYTLTVVLFAASLFFAGISTRLRSSAARIVTLGVVYALFLGSAIWIATFPVSLSV
jgi:hypothetical protein